MTTKNFGPAISGYLNPDGRNWETVVFEAGKPVLDKELNLSQDLDIGAAQLALRAMPSGWLSSDFLNTSSASSGIFIDPAGVALTWVGPEGVALVNGWVLNVTNTDVVGGNQLPLPTGPIGVGTKRTDIIVLEVWRCLLSASPSTVGKSQTGRIWAYGNVKVPAGSDAILNYTDDILDTNVGSESTKRVQLQYRLRIVQDVDLFAYPNGLDDPTVMARTVPPTAATPDGNATLFAYSNQSSSGDSGLWRAGDGNPLNSLGTVDGYMYAIPLLAMFRRNTTAFDKNTNQNGGVATPGPSDRPDGLFQDVLYAEDVADLRFGTTQAGWSYPEVLEKNVNLLLDNNARSEWTLTPIGGGSVGHTVLWADEIGVLPGDHITTGDTPGAAFLAQFDGVRRFFSDRAVLEVVTIKIDAPLGGWTPGGSVTINPTAMSIYPYAAADFAARAPADVLFADIVSARWTGPTAGKVNVDALPHLVVTGLATMPVTAVTLTYSGAAVPGLSDEPLFVELLVEYPTGQGLSSTPTGDFGAASVSLNNPLAMPAAAPVSYGTLGWAFDYPHREIELSYRTSTITASFAADTGTAGQSVIRLPERAASIAQVRKNTIPIVGAATLDSTGRVITLGNVLDYTNPGDVLAIDYIAARPLPNNGEQVTIWYNTRAPQTIRSSILGTSLTVVPLYVAPWLHTMTVGSGSPDEAYPFPYQYVQTAGVYPTSAGTFAGDHEMVAGSTIDVSVFNANTGFLRLPVLMPYVPQPETVHFTRGLLDTDIEGRSFFKSIPPGGYLPNAYAQNLSDPTRHRVILPVLAELTSDGALGRRGQLLLVLLQRYAEFDEQNSVVFNSNLTLNTTTASVFRIKGHLLKR
jgi:hypothetical protein